MPLLCRFDRNLVFFPIESKQQNPTKSILSEKFSKSYRASSIFTSNTTYIYRVRVVYSMENFRFFFYLKKKILCILYLPTLPLEYATKRCSVFCVFTVQTNCFCEDYIRIGVIYHHIYPVHACHCSDSI